MPSPLVPTYAAYTGPLWLSTLALVALALYAWRLRQMPSAGPFALTALILAIWPLAYALDIASASLGDKTYLTWVRVVVAALAPLPWLATVFRLTGQWRWVGFRGLVGLGVVPAITIALAWPGGQHCLFRCGFRLDPVGPFVALIWQNGPWHWVHVVYSNTLLLLAVGALLLWLRYAKPLYRRQALVIVLATVLPIPADLSFQLELLPLPYNPTAIALALSGVLVAWGLFRYRMLDIAPIARGLVVESMQDLMVVLDEQDRVVDLNPALAKAAGVSPAQAIGQPAEESLACFGEILSHYRAVASLRDEVARCEQHGRDYSVSISPIRDGRGRFIGRLILLHDVTELRRAREAAEAVAQARAAFLAQVTHELRTPLNLVISFSRLLLDGSDGALTSGQQRKLTLILRSANQLLHSVDDLLDLARLDAGKETATPREIDVAELLAELRETFEPLASPAVALVVEEPVEVPQLYADGEKLAEILRNLLANALKFTERGEVRVSVCRGDDGRTVRFAVRDTGVGIAPADQERIFEVFTPLAAGSGSRRKGTGLGLAISRRLAELLGGSLRVESEPGAGSTFTLEVPLRAGD